MRALRVLTPLLMMGAATACLPGSPDDVHPEELHLMETSLSPVAGASALLGDSLLIAGTISSTSGAAGGAPSRSELRELDGVEWY